MFLYTHSHRSHKHTQKQRREQKKKNLRGSISFSFSFSATATATWPILKMDFVSHSVNHNGMRAAGLPTNIMSNVKIHRDDLKESTREPADVTPKLMTANCSICAETVTINNFVAVSCCHQTLCQACVNHIIEAKATHASEILALYLSRTAHQCPKCETGPIEHFACSDLTGSSHNRCPKCKFSAASINSWPKWNGRLCKSLQAYSPDGKHIDCPFCRQYCSLLIATTIDHCFQPKRKSLKSPLSSWCKHCNLHKDQHLLEDKRLKIK
jgi:hypothetical protein